MNETKTVPKATVTRGHVIINTEECKGCELCIASCPVNVLYLSESFNIYGYHTATYTGEGCTGCGLCFYNCPEPGAITVFRRWDLVTETAYCPNCGRVQKIFPKETDPDTMVCSVCLKPIPKEPAPPEKVITIK